MLSIAIAVALWLPALVGLGGSLPSPADPGLRRGVAGLLGLGVLGAAAVLVNFFAPVNPAVSSCLWATGVALLVLRRRHLREGVSAAEIAGAAVGLALAFCWYKPPSASYDSGLYYLQVVRWITEQPLRIGLGNLHGRLAFDGLWGLVAGATELPLLAGRSFAFVNVLPMVLVSGLAAVGLGRVVAGSRTAGDAALTVLFPVAGHAVAGLGAAASDPCAELLIMVSFALWVCALDGDDRTFREDALPAALMTLLAILVKLSSVPLLAAPVVALFARRRALSLRWAVALLLPCSLAVLPWLTRTFLLCGCLLYPVALTCTSHVPWAVPLANVVTEAAWIRSWARAPGPRLLDALGDWTWLRAWCAAQLLRIDVRLYAGTAAVGLGLVAWVRPRCPGLLLALGTSALGLGYLLVVAPDPRFGFGFLHALGLVPLACALTALPVARRALARVPLSLAIVGAAAALTVGWALLGNAGLPVRLDPLAFPDHPSIPVVEKVTASGLRILAPARGDQCWGAPIPCTPYFDVTLSEQGRRYLAGPGGLQR